MDSPRHIAFFTFTFPFPNFPLQVKRDMVAIKHELDTVQQVKEEIEELREYVDRLEEHTHRRKLRLLEQVCSLNYLPCCVIIIFKMQNSKQSQIPIILKLIPKKYIYLNIFIFFYTRKKSPKSHIPQQIQ